MSTSFLAACVGCQRLTVQLFRVRFTRFSVARGQSYLSAASKPFHQSDSSVHVSSGSRLVHASTHCYGLEEFFPAGENLIEDAEKTGRSWEVRELRNKSFQDLHKLWYVLLKERNMLLTVQHEANRQRFIMPAPERLKKVKRSMARIKFVIGERERAVRKAQDMLHQERLAAAQHDSENTDTSVVVETDSTDTTNEETSARSSG